MSKSLAFSALFFNLLIVMLIIPFQYDYRILVGVFLIFLFIIMDLKATMNLIQFLPYIDTNPYIYGLLTLHPYTHIIILYKLSEYDYRSLLKSICTLGMYNGLWFDKLIKSETYNLEKDTGE